MTKPKKTVSSLVRTKRQAAELVSAARAREGVGQGREAARMGRKAVLLDPCLTEGYRQIGLYLFNSQRPVPATGYLRRILLIDPGDRANFDVFMRGLVLLNDFEEMARQARTVVEREPDRADARYWLGRALHKLGSLENARDHLNAALRADRALARDIRFVGYTITTAALAEILPGR
ncbi:MAG: tetratricopeptide repeat protein [Rhodospirillaceae bacterium]|jgi:tetratricopeptide (TPR) repeat protein|nr:tetratricopeptide repeat protein [Rhodospirillaceae bacterium]MBT6136237.1 tetratricopeptide repeat protein [Rhodospirillaceae bacterium]